MSDERLTDLEIKLAFQEHTIHALDGVVRELQEKIDRLEHRIRELAEEHASSLGPLDNPPPPHW
ncbi:MAG: SlyX family protein [Myxococcota bacterium]